MRPCSTRSTFLAEVLFVLHILLLIFRGANASLFPKFSCCNPPNPEPQPKSPVVCVEPLEGKWYQEHWFAGNRFQSTLLHGADSHFDVKRAFGNVYMGKALGTVRGVPFASNISSNMLAIFDEETCTLSGSFYNFKLRVNEPFQWTVNTQEKKMKGCYINLFINGRPLLSTRGILNASYEGSFSE